MEVIIADGRSTDQTLKEIASFQHDHPDLQVDVVDNPERIIPAGLNRAIQKARGEIIIRLDGHSKPDPDYVARCVESLEQGCGDNVGGVWEIHPRDRSWQARSIATAAAHPLGVGDAYYRVGRTPQKVDTVPFGAFKRSVIDRIGPFDESLLTNEDYEFNTRLRRAGGIIWLDPRIRTVYFPPGSIASLARQYWRYGFWKARMLQRYPESIRWRQALPPAFAFSLILFSVSGIWLPLARWILSIQIGIYLLVLFIAAVQAWIKKHDAMLLLGLPLAIATMHIMWGAAFLWSLVRRKI
jgi:succinoglycan biosynthesis protein ExoA